MNTIIDSSTIAPLDYALNLMLLTPAELYLDLEIPRVSGAPSPLDFHRNWVCPNKPVVFTDAFEDWPALPRWNNEYLR